jgi:hypothetical protein
LKLDFCRMTRVELIRVFDAFVRDDSRGPDRFMPIVAIGHTKDLEDCGVVESFLAHLARKGIAVSTIAEAYGRCGDLT